MASLESRIEHLKDKYLKEYSELSKLRRLVDIQETRAYKVCMEMNKLIYQWEKLHKKEYKHENMVH